MEQQGQKNKVSTFNFESFTPPEHYNAALYCRFSRDDGQASDSSSIETQKMLLRKYCTDNGYKVFDIYVDDGYTGLNFDRPDFQRMLADIESGKVNLVITKDQSRLGRDYIQTGYYTEIYFTDHNVRYIAINDGADTARPENADFMPFRNIINNMYSKDISCKTKSAIRQRALNGLFTKSYAPYGYKKHPDNISKIIIDEEVADVVREIFRLSLEGKGTAAICKILSAKQILIPAAYKVSKGVKGFSHQLSKRPNTETKWRYRAVYSILKDQTYCGDLVSRRTEVVNYKTGKQIKVPKDKQIIVENTHEAIISREDFARVQQLVTARAMPKKYDHEENIFKGLIKCGDCGKSMTMSYRKIKTTGGAFKIRYIYRCSTHQHFPDDCLTWNYVYKDELTEQIATALNKFLRLMQSDDSILKAGASKTAKVNKNDKLLTEKSKTEKRLSTLSVLIRKLYEDFVAETLTETNYKEFLSVYQKEQATLNERLAAINGELGEVDDYSERLLKLQAIAKTYAEQTELTAEMLNKLIARIEIGQIKKADGKKTQEIKIIYRFINTTLN